MLISPKYNRDTSNGNMGFIMEKYSYKTKKIRRKPFKKCSFIINFFLCEFSETALSGNKREAFDAVTFDTDR